LRKPPKKQVIKNDNLSYQKRQLNKKRTLLYIKENRELAISLYDFYKNEISPLRKTRKAAIKNISYYLQEYNFETLKNAIKNYGTTVKENAPQFRKNPSNFFGRTGDSERYFEDYLDKNIKQEKITDPFRPSVLTDEEITKELMRNE
jgi:hypothetical protein